MSDVIFYALLLIAVAIFCLITVFLMLSGKGTLAGFITAAAAFIAAASFAGAVAADDPYVGLMLLFVAEVVGLLGLGALIGLGLGAVWRQRGG